MSREAGGPSFREVLLNSLEQVNRLQQEANEGVEKLMTGQTDNLAAVFTAVRKSDVAFSMLMEMRNKLIDAYREIQQMRV
ncbi:MAG: flagellar hook-basal body complex protein FliE [Phycisphaerae bacterium]|nr:flagellar hook-basal body complex protein FliE [Phycisphaerae bacterium]